MKDQPAPIMVVIRELGNGYPRLFQMTAYWVSSDGELKDSSDCIQWETLQRLVASKKSNLQIVNEQPFLATATLKSV